MIYINPNFFKEILLEKNKKGEICTRVGPAWIFLLYVAVIMLICAFLFFFNLLDFTDITKLNYRDIFLTFFIFISGISIIWIYFAQKNILTKNFIIIRRSFFYLKVPIEILRQEILKNPPQIFNNKIIFYIKQKKVIINLTLNCTGSFGFVNEIFKRTKTPYPIELLTKYLYNQNCTFARYFKVENNYLQSELDITSKKKH